VIAVELLKLPQKSETPRTEFGSATNRESIKKKDLLPRQQEEELKKKKK